MSPGKAMAGITGGNSALGLFSICFFSTLGFNPLILMFLKLLFLLQSGVVPQSWLSTHSWSPEGEMHCGVGCCGTGESSIPLSHLLFSTAFQTSFVP